VLHNPPALVIGRHAIGPVCAKRYIVRRTRSGRPISAEYRRPVRAPVVDEAQQALALEFA
jgi:hypothetical protein